MQKGDRHNPVGAFVRIGPLLGIPAILQELGHDPGPVLKDAGFQAALFTDPDTEISYVAASRLLASCVATTGRRDFGLLVGGRAGPSSLGIAGFMLHSAADVGMALRGLLQNLDLHDQGGTPTLQIKGSITLLGYAIHQPGSEATDQIYDLSMAIACNIMRNLCGRHWNPTEVYLSHRQPGDLTSYRHFFRAPLSFNADKTAVAFQTRWLDHRISGADDQLHRYLEREAAALHKLRKTGIASELRRLLRRSLAAGNASADDLAGHLGLHVRTLNRRLRGEGTSFRRELDGIRYETARQLLAESSMPIARIAKVLNYADASAFSRAFKRWSGLTPDKWRSRNVTSPES
jgi:AraC-like DNA-binding protein